MVFDGLLVKSEDKLLLKIILGILAAIGAMVVLAVFLLAVAYFVLVRRLSRRMQETVGEMEAMLTKTIDANDFHEIDEPYDDDLVPPMLITLEESSRALYEESDLCRRIDAWMLDHGFNRIGCFAIVEFDEEELCVYLSDDRKLVGAIRQRADESLPFVEFCFDLSDERQFGLRGGVSNPPGGTLQLPPEAVGKHFVGSLQENFELLSQMWLEAKELVDQHRVRLVDPSKIEEFYEEAHASEMELRVRQGGVSEKEIRDSFRAQGVEVSDSDVEEILTHWRVAIADHLLSCSSKAEDLYDSGRHILIVYERMETHSLLNHMREFFDSLEYLSPPVESLLEELRQLLTQFSPRDAVARFRPLLPSEMRYTLIDQIQSPIEADFYLMAAPIDV